MDKFFFINLPGNDAVMRFVFRLILWRVHPYVFAFCQNIFNIKRVLTKIFELYATINYIVHHLMPLAMKLLNIGGITFYLRRTDNPIGKYACRYWGRWFYNHMFYPYKIARNTKNLHHWITFVVLLPQLLFNIGNNLTESVTRCSGPYTDWKKLLYKYCKVLWGKSLRLPSTNDLTCQVSSFCANNRVVIRTDSRKKQWAYHCFCNFL